MPTSPHCEPRTAQTCPSFFHSSSEAAAFAAVDVGEIEDDDRMIIDRVHLFFEQHAALGALTTPFVFPLFPIVEKFGALRRPRQGLMMRSHVIVVVIFSYIFVRVGALINRFANEKKTKQTSV